MNRLIESFSPSLSLPLLGRPFGLPHSLTIVPSERISKSPVGASDDIGREARVGVWWKGCRKQLPKVSFSAAFSQVQRLKWSIVRFFGMVWKSPRVVIGPSPKLSLGELGSQEKCDSAGFTLFPCASMKVQLLKPPDITAAREKTIIWVERAPNMAVFCRRFLLPSHPR